MIEKLIIVSGNQINAPHKRKNSNNINAYAIQRSQKCNIIDITNGNDNTNIYSKSYTKIMIN